MNEYDETPPPPFERGDYVRTIKGAHFWGIVVSVYVLEETEWRVDVLAIAPGFEGTLHVYPAKQLERRPVPAESLYHP